MELAVPFDLSARGRKGLPSAMFASFAVHAVLVGVFFAASRFEPPKLDLAPKPVSAKLVRLGEKRPENLLPRKEIAPPSQRAPRFPTMAPTPSPARPTRAASLFDKVAKSPASLFDRVGPTPPGAIFDKVEGDPRGDPEGDAADATEGEKYYGLMTARIRREFKVGGVPQAELKRLTAILEVKLNPRGELVHVEVATSSGNGVFDAEVVSAVKRAAPFAAPPDHLRDELGAGVGLQFKF